MEVRWTDRNWKRAAPEHLRNPQRCRRRSIVHTTAVPKHMLLGARESQTPSWKAEPVNDRIPNLLSVTFWGFSIFWENKMW